jgi:hypothetical protein
MFILTVLGAGTVFAAVSLANTGSRGAIRAQVPGEAKTLAAHRVSPSGKAKLGLVYMFSDIEVAAGETNGGAIKCPKNWHPVSGLFSSESDGVLAASDAPTSERKWAVFVLNQGTSKVAVTIGAVCEKGLPITQP